MSVTITPTRLAIATTAHGSGPISGTSSAVLSATGGSGRYSWSLVGGSLPPGMHLDNTGRLIGMPAARGTALVTVRATDTSVPAQFEDAQITVVVS